MVTRLEMLVDGLDGQLSKRRKELTDVRLMSSGASGSTAGTIRRAGHVLAYSHWEGFSKYALRQYLGYLSDAELIVDSLKLPLQVLNYWKDLKSLAGNMEFASAISLMKSFAQSDSSYFDVDSEEMTKTGNLDSKRFRSLLNICALEYRPMYQTRENFIDQVLCGRRHRISHGLLEPVSEADFNEVLDGATELCEEINEQIQDALIYDRYKG
jgi:MAE_28990/MAE_18760-like HEPN